MADLKWGNLRFWKNAPSSPDFAYRLEGKTIYPPSSKLFRAFELCPYKDTRVLILGQDPYHTKGLADGLAFSVPPHIHHLPPTLKNIFREYSNDLGHPTPSHGDLSGWARQGVLLLNTALSVEEGKPRSHKNIGWEELIYEVIRKLSNEKSNVVFFLWGKDAQEFKGIIDTQKHLVLETSHPSPLSCHKGFFGSKPFSKTNEYFRGLDTKLIEWKLP